jgi:hypothetical protein
VDLHGAQLMAVFDSFDPDRFYFRELPIVVVHLAFDLLSDNHGCSPVDSHWQRDIGGASGEKRVEAALNLIELTELQVLGAIDCAHASAAEQRDHAVAISD